MKKNDKSSAMFSGALKLANVDDYLSPSAKCVIPIVSQSNDDKMTASVSLSDCLSCSGCLTSSEEVILSSQGLEQLKATLAFTKDKIMVASVSLPVIASFASTYAISLDLAFRKIVTFLNNIGVKYVFDTRFAHSLVRALISSEIEANITKPGFPVISSECPAWVLYAYKKLSNELLPSLSLVKSQQKIMGILIKVAGKNKLQEVEGASKEIYHIAICQCNDKKVEAALNAEEEKEIDLMLTAKEIHDFMKENKQDFDKIEPAVAMHSIEEFLILGETIEKYKELVQVPMGYIETIYNKLNSLGKPLSFVTTGNKDFRVVETVIKGGNKFKAALVGGYRNIQKVLAMLKSGKCSYNYIELYACPGECWGGAGLLETTDKLADKIKEKFGSEEGGDLAEEFLKRQTSIVELLKSKPFKKEEGKATVSSVSW